MLAPTSVGLAVLVTHSSIKLSRQTPKTRQQSTLVSFVVLATVAIEPTASVQGPSQLATGCRYTCAGVYKTTFDPVLILFVATHIKELQQFTPTTLPIPPLQWTFSTIIHLSRISFHVPILRSIPPLHRIHAACHHLALRKSLLMLSTPLFPHHH